MGYLNVNDVLTNLQQRGFVYIFQYCQSGLSSPDTEQQWSLEEYEVLECYHYRKVTKPVGSIIILAIQTCTGQKGVLIETYGEIPTSYNSYLSAPPKPVLDTY